MAQSLIHLPSETVFAECRAFVFFYDIQLNRWSEIAEPNVYSRIQLLCSRPSGSTGQYRIFGRLETTGMVRSKMSCLIKHKVSGLINLNLPYATCTGKQRMSTPLTCVSGCTLLLCYPRVLKSFALSSKWAYWSKWLKPAVSIASSKNVIVRVSAVLKELLLVAWTTLKPIIGCFKVADNVQLVR